LKQGALFPEAKPGGYNYFNRPIQSIAAYFEQVNFFPAFYVPSVHMIFPFRMRFQTFFPPYKSTMMTGKRKGFFEAGNALAYWDCSCKLSTKIIRNGN
jgi:hypothetical protein